MTIIVAGTTFDYFDYDPLGDTLYLGLGGPAQEPAYRAYETPDGHIVEYDRAGSIIAIELLNVRWHLERTGEIVLACPDVDPDVHHVAPSSLEPVIAAA
jgi:uncharacterized protein YuzE